MLFLPLLLSQSLLFLFLLLALNEILRHLLRNLGPILLLFPLNILSSLLNLFPFSDELFLVATVFLELNYLLLFRLLSSGFYLLLQEIHILFLLSFL